MAGPAPRPPSGLPEVTAAVRIALPPCRKAGKTSESKHDRESSGESRSKGSRMSVEKEIFTNIYKTKFWGDSETVSGLGATKFATRHLIRELPQLFQRYSIESVLDIPCGDFNWMQNVNFKNIEYMGADIVSELIKDNIAKFPNFRFAELNLISDPLPKVDLIMCINCLYHLPFESIHKALANFKKSGSRFLLTTSHTWKSMLNTDISAGNFRRLNLELDPFNLPNPVEIIVEGNTENNGDQADRALCLWPCYQL
jgi:2-polyprenyl-3-methyl-5-hydroxy-6-metoxy-1,4-benzoquinol methylase